jgi:hypothetical protein
MKSSFITLRLVDLGIKMLEIMLISFFLILANLPWFTSRVFCFFPVTTIKSPKIRLIELLVYYGIVMLVGRAIEMDFSGEVYPQQWEFFVTTFSVFLVLSAPGVIYRYQWLTSQRKSMPLK